MTTTGISKTVFFGLMIGAKLADMAVAETDSTNRLYLFIILAGLVIIYWAKQTILEYRGRPNGSTDKQENQKDE